MSSSFMSEMAVRKSKSPTPMRKASSVKPKRPNRLEPNTSSISPMMKMARAALPATKYFSRLVWPRMCEMKALSTAGGVMSA